MPKKAFISIDLTPEAYAAPADQVVKTIKHEAKIPFCKQIEKVTLDDITDSYTNLKKHGISSNVAQNIIDLYTQE
jgi:hypothetical protein